jgi:hypothetical protein
MGMLTNVQFIAEKRMKHCSSIRIYTIAKAASEQGIWSG